jgi:glycosyltransferase involved in cell wall biosynthesis
MEWPEVTVLVCTYEREYELARTLETLMERLSYPNLRWLLCDDASPSNFALKIAYQLLPISATSVVHTQKTSGWGANVNNGLRSVKTDYVFFTEDDKYLHRHLDLRVGIALMEVRPDIGMVRYKGTAGTELLYLQQEADIVNWLPGFHEGPNSVVGKLNYLELGDGPTLYVYSNGPHLKHRRFHEAYGMYPEGLKLGQTEEAYAHSVRGQMTRSKPRITILPDWVIDQFEDFGRSYQGSEKDV